MVHVRPTDQRKGHTMTNHFTITMASGRTFDIVSLDDANGRPHYMAINNERPTDCSRSFRHMMEAMHEAYNQDARNLPATRR